MKSIFITLFLLVYGSMFSQKLAEVDGRYQSRVEYSVSGRDKSIIYEKCNQFLETELSDKQTLSTSKDDKLYKFSGTGSFEKYQFDYEVFCFDNSFKIIFTNFTYKSKSIDQHTNKIGEINQYLVKLCGKMQYFVRYS